MPNTTIVFAVLLVILGLGAYAASFSNTALLPAAFGVVLGVLALLAARLPGARKALMHVAVIVALFGALAPAATLVIRASAMSTLALSVNLGMLVLCGALLVLMVRSFIAARRARA